MQPVPIYEERLNASYPMVIAVFLFALIVGLVPGIVLGGLSWLTVLYLALTVGIIASFFQMKIELFEDKLVVKFGFLYHKIIKVQKMKACSVYRIPHPVRTYGGWGIRGGRDGTFALTQAFISEGIKLETSDKTFVISSRTPENFCVAIKSALSQKG